MKARKNLKIVHILYIILMIALLGITVSNAGVMDDIINAEEDKVGVIYQYGPNGNGSDAPGFGIDEGMPYFEYKNNTLDNIIEFCLNPEKGHTGIAGSTYLVRRINDDNNYNNIVKIRQMRYIIGYNISNNNNLKITDWNVIKQFACWELFYR